MFVSVGYTLNTSIKMTDRGLSGFDGENLMRGKLGRFIELVKQGKVKPGSVLIVESLDRLTRQQVRTALKLFLDILDHDIEIVTLIEPYEWFKPDSLNEVQLIIAIVILSRAYNESATKSVRLKKRWVKKRQQLFEEGVLITGRTPSWIIKKGNTFELHREKSLTVARIVKMYLDGLGVVSIVRKLNEEEVPTLGIGKQKAKMWGKSTVLKTLRNRSLIGEFQPHFGRKSQDQSQRKPAGDVIADYFPAVISEADFYRVQNRLASKKLVGRTGNGAGSVSNLFTGLLFDARDGSTMNIVDKGAKSGGKQIVSSAAKNGRGSYISFNYNAFETTMLHLMKNISPQDILPAQSTSVVEQLDCAEAELGAVENRISLIQRSLEDTDIDLDVTLMPVLSKLTEQKHEIESQLELIRAELHSSLPTAGECGELADLVQGTTGDVNQHRRHFRLALNDIVERIDVLTLKDGHWRQCFARVAFFNGRTRIVVASVHRKRLVASGGFDGDYPITTAKCQKHLQQRLSEMKVRSVETTEANLNDQMTNAAIFRRGIVELGERSISVEDWPSEALAGASE